VYPALHWKSHVELAQIELPLDGGALFEPLPQAFAHEPQLFTSSVKFTHEMLGSIPHALGVDPLHVTPQVLLHVALPVPTTGPGHLLPHPPQLPVSFPKLTHVPFAPSLAHRSGRLPGHAGAHALDTHDVAPFAGALHLCAHAPQLFGSSVRFSHDVGAPTGHPV